MASSLLAYVENRNQGGIEVSKTVALLRRYAFIEQSCVRVLAGWFLKFPEWEAKLALGHHLWAHAERANLLRCRLEELRGGHRDANIEPRLSMVGEELLHAPDEASFLAGLTWALSELAGAYEGHLEVADSTANAMEARMMQRLLPDAERELEAVSALKQRFANRDGDQRALQWAKYLSGLLEAAGGMTGLQPGDVSVPPRPEESRFERPTRITFDDRIQPGELGSYESKLSKPLEERRLAEFEVFFNEFYAAALMATIIYDAWNISAPRQFFVDIAHHFWDEVRHAEFGARRLRELGVEPSKVNQMLFEQAQGLPLLHRLCYLILGLEVYFMPRKRPRMRYYGAQGDHRSQLFADVDWSDEQNHVRYGKQWVEYFLRDDARTIEDVQEEISKYLESMESRLAAGQRAPF